jgi:hypothetical protein
MRTTDSFETKAEKQSLIININTMRDVAKLDRIDFEILWNKSIDSLREEQDNTIKMYNESFKK